MKNLLTVLIIAAFAVGCAGSITKQGASVVVGSAEIGTNCNAAGECESLLVGNGFTEGFMAFGERVVELGVGIVTFFIPSGFSPGEDN